MFAWPRNDERSLPECHEVSAAARQAYSHWASVGSRQSSRRRTSAQTLQLTFSTGFLHVTCWPLLPGPGLMSLGLRPVRQNHCPWVISYFESRKGTRLTRWGGPSMSDASGSNLG